MKHDEFRIDFCDSDLIKKEPSREKAIFKMSNTVVHFTTGCQKYGVADVFIPDNLVNGTNFAAVIETVHRLSDLVTISQNFTSFQISQYRSF